MMETMPSRTERFFLAALAALAAACIDDPIYLEPPAALEVVGGEGGRVATGQVTLPVRLETEAESAERAALGAELGIQVPYVKRSDLDLSVEWTIKNLDAEPGVARIHVNGANELFAYVPGAFIIDPEEEDPPPPLTGDVPLEVPAGGQIDGVFQEDLLSEASLDLELITRGGISPFAAMLESQEHRKEISTDGGPSIPREAFASLVRFDLAFFADRHMVLEYTVRVRDHHDPALLHDELADAPAEELTTFAPADFAPAL